MRDWAYYTHILAVCVCVLSALTSAGAHEAAATLQQVDPTSPAGHRDDCSQRGTVLVTLAPRPPRPETLGGHICRVQPPLGFTCLVKLWLGMQISCVASFP